ncbi:MAG: hypothetical protein ACRDSL_00820 [Pseudonocardiaceae bacterium]
MIEKPARLAGIDLDDDLDDDLVDRLVDDTAGEHRHGDRPCPADRPGA